LGVFFCGIRIPLGVPARSAGAPSRDFLACSPDAAALSLPLF